MGTAPQPPRPDPDSPAPGVSAGADYLTVVSGLPRSGTSMMMRALEAGGHPVLTDNLRAANEDNPGGYYEFEPVKALNQDAGWVPAARGRAVKIIYKLVYDLPRGTPCRIIFLQRDLAEVVASQERMLERSGQPAGAVPADMMIQLFQSEVLAFRNWAASQPNLRLLPVDYAALVADPAPALQQIAAFLERDLDLDAMARVIDPTLYRNRT